MWRTNKLDLVNTNGDKLCEYFGCRKHTKLVEKYSGLFCKNHAKEIGKIRSVKGKESDIYHEISWRMREQVVRKRQCPLHWNYILWLTKRIN